jgi:hypothetical protein
MPRIPKRMTGGHDKVVRGVATKLKQDGWDVKADLPGRRKPDPVGKVGRVPDIEATKGGATKLIEVETSATLAGHKDQISTFRRSAAQKSRTTFDVVIADGE